jgi:general secretion pathway protein K
MDRARQGVVIIAVLWICALLMWFALQISSATRLQGAADLNHLRRIQALYAAIGGSYEALARLGQSASLLGALGRDSESTWQPDGLPHVVEYQSGVATVVVEEEETRVNVNQANHTQLRNAIEAGGVEGDAADVLADSILDFIDADDLPRLKGAEKDHYEQQGLRHGPFNGQILSLDQLLLVPGITWSLLYGGYPSASRGEAPPEHGQNGAGGPKEFFGKQSLVAMLTVYGNNVLVKRHGIEEGGELDDTSPVAWESGKIYRILTRGESHGGSPAVFIWLIVRYLPQSDLGYEVMFCKVF